MTGIFKEEDATVSTIEASKKIGWFINGTVAGYGCEYNASIDSSVSEGTLDNAFNAMVLSGSWKKNLSVKVTSIEESHEYAALQKEEVVSDEVTRFRDLLVKAKATKPVYLTNSKKKKTRGDKYTLCFIVRVEISIPAFVEGVVTDTLSIHSDMSDTCLEELLQHVEAGTVPEYSITGITDPRVKKVFVAKQSFDNL